MRICLCALLHVIAFFLEFNREFYLYYPVFPYPVTQSLNRCLQAWRRLGWIFCGVCFHGS